jgi:hypothetical protein
MSVDDDDDDGVGAWWPYFRDIVLMADCLLVLAILRAGLTLAGF